ncbi:MAG TPA: 3'-5' exonuclease [Bacteroidales bacterium]|nr:3'-5' exonuclease [Bacteroidales bacterium]HQG35865.1 3'-5' exonuclease [Bacteroidales bacterium]HQG52375.1 3'-5' exonuclease [Bacteroidales bacterium]HQJ20126.1 3'-5' exonuclease [Bacteroidales bacterium]HRC89503.1 3'-5' exonuclease [Bacteroidales bacterium]
MFEDLKLENVLFLDIETVPSAASYEELSPLMQSLWDKKSASFREVSQSASEVYQRAGIYAEFGKIICISAGFVKEKEPFGFRLKSFFGDDEKTILSEFSSMLKKISSSRDAVLCAHNGKEFDYPYIARRMIVNSLSIPNILDNAGKKPWEVKLLDTMELWKFGDHKNYTSLETLSAILGIDSSKDDIDGSMVSDVYWKEHDIKRIVKYCEKDVICVAQILLRFMNTSAISLDKIESITVF